MDPAPNHMYPYLLTLTSSDGFSSVQEGQILHWCRTHTDKCMLVRELHDSGKAHYHALVCTDTKLAQGVTRKLETLYRLMNIEFTPCVSINVKKVTDLVGAMHYLSKDIPVSENPLLCTGWRYSWIKSECLGNIKKIPHCVLKKDQYMVQNSSSVQLIIRYANAGGFPLCGKQSFITVTTEMQGVGYQFEKIKPKWLYAQVMAMVGHKDLARRVWEDALFGLD